MALLEIKDLALGYDGQVIVDHLDFCVNAGDYLCIVGENGSGKTTLMRTILGLQDPLSGTIVRDDSLMKGGIGWLPQQTTVQKDFPASVREVVLSGCLGHSGLRPFYSRRDRETAAQSMQRMGIDSLASRSYRDLSGGQQQRVLLARALCAAQSILLLDEPVTGLDPKAAAEMYELIERLNRDGMVVIMITHDTKGAVRYATHVLHIGSTVFYGTRDAYLGSGAGSAYLQENEGGKG